MFEPVEKFLRGALMIYLGKEKGGGGILFFIYFSFSRISMFETWYKQGGLPEKCVGWMGGLFVIQLSRVGKAN